jgi:hypothetical protein
LISQLFFERHPKQKCGIAFHPNLCITTFILIIMITINNEPKAKPGKRNPLKV